MPNCAVHGCYNYHTKTKGSGVKYFRFPKDPHTREKWLSACSRDKPINIDKATICSQHFTKESFAALSTDDNNFVYYMKLRFDAVPTENLPINYVTNKISAETESISIGSPKLSKKRKSNTSETKSSQKTQKRRRKQKFIDENHSPNVIHDSLYIPDEFCQQLKKSYEFCDPTWLVHEVIGCHFLCD